MTRNDVFFKILFAIEIALLPLAMASHYLMPEWSVGMFVAGILVAKVWLELFKNKDEKSHIVINSIGNFLTISTLVVFFTVLKYINVVVCVFVVLLALLMNVLKVLCHGKILPEIIDAVDSCYTLFECLTLIALTFVVFYQLITNIAVFALLLTSAVSVIYKIYYICRNLGAFDKIKSLFRKK